jgi:GntR family transcriptional regulator
MLLTINLESSQPIYIQIRNSIVEGIANGMLKDGDPLPSVRILATELGINLHTVNKAYQMLKMEGFVKVYRKKGTVISAETRDSRDFMEAAAATLKNIVSEAITRSISREQLTGMINQMYNEMEGKKP